MATATASKKATRPKIPTDVLSATKLVAKILEIDLKHVELVKSKHATSNEMCQQQDLLLFGKDLVNIRVNGLAGTIKVKLTGRCSAASFTLDPKKPEKAERFWVALDQIRLDYALAIQAMNELRSIEADLLKRVTKLLKPVRPKVKASIRGLTRYESHNYPYVALNDGQTVYHNHGLANAAVNANGKITLILNRKEAIRDLISDFDIHNSLYALPNKSKTITPVMALNAAAKQAQWFASFGKRVRVIDGCVAFTDLTDREFVELVARMVAPDLTVVDDGTVKATTTTGEATNMLPGMIYRSDFRPK